MRSAAGSSGGVHAGTHEKAETGFGLRMEHWCLCQPKVEIANEKVGDKIQKSDILY